MATIAVEQEHSDHYPDEQIELLQEWYDRMEHTGSIRYLLEAAGVEYEVIEYEQTDLHFYVSDLIRAKAKMLSAVENRVASEADKAIFANFQSTIEKVF